MKASGPPVTRSSGKVEATAVICNLRGLHARASAKFCAVAGAYDAKVEVAYDGWSASGDSIMGLMMLGAGHGSEIKISATGRQAAEAVDTLVKLVADRFGEEE